MPSKKPSALESMPRRGGPREIVLHLEFDRQERWAFGFYLGDGRGGFFKIDVEDAVPIAADYMISIGRAIEAYIKKHPAKAKKP